VASRLVRKMLASSGDASWLTAPWTQSSPALQRDPERLLDRLTLLLTEPRGAENGAGMARLLRTIGVPRLNLLEAALRSPPAARHCSNQALAAADPERLLRGLARALGVGIGIFRTCGQ